MWNRLTVNALRVLLAGAFVLILLLQLVYLPWLSGEVAADLPAEAHMRWPILGLAVAGLAMVQVAIVCTWRLLGFTQQDRVFSPAALRWVDGIIGAFLGGSVVCAATIGYHLATVGGPSVWMLLLLCGTFAGVGLALLMTVMRTLLLRATSLRQEMELVV